MNNKKIITVKMKILKKALAAFVAGAFLFNDIAFAADFKNLAPQAGITLQEFKDRYLAGYILLSHEAVNDYIEKSFLIEDDSSVRWEDITINFKGEKIVIPIRIVPRKGLIKNTGQVAHIGLGNAKYISSPSIYIDYDYRYDPDILANEKEKIAKWELKRRELGKTYAGMREWIKSNPGEARALADKFHKSSHNISHIYKEIIQKYKTYAVRGDFEECQKVFDFDQMYEYFDKFGLNEESNDANLAANANPGDMAGRREELRALPASIESLAMQYDIGFESLTDSMIESAYENAQETANLGSNGGQKRLPTLTQFAESLPLISGIDDFPAFKAKAMRALKGYNERHRDAPLELRELNGSNIKTQDQLLEFIASQPDGLVSWEEIEKKFGVFGRNTAEGLKERSALSGLQARCRSSDDQIVPLIFTQSKVDKLRRAIQIFEDGIEYGGFRLRGVASLKEIGRAVGLKSKALEALISFKVSEFKQVLDDINHNRKIANETSRTDKLLLKMVDPRLPATTFPVIKLFLSDKHDGLWTREEVAAELGWLYTRAVANIYNVRNKLGYEFLNYNFRILKMPPIIPPVEQQRYKEVLLGVLRVMEELGGVAAVDDVWLSLRDNYGSGIKRNSVKIYLSEARPMIRAVNARRAHRNAFPLRQLMLMRLDLPVKYRSAVQLSEFEEVQKGGVLYKTALNAHRFFIKRFGFAGYHGYRFDALPDIYGRAFSEKSDFASTFRNKSKAASFLYKTLKHIIENAPQPKPGAGRIDPVIGNYFRVLVPRALNITGQYLSPSNFDEFKHNLARVKAGEYPLVVSLYGNKPMVKKISSDYSMAGPDDRKKPAIDKTTLPIFDQSSTVFVEMHNVTNYGRYINAMAANGFKFAKSFLVCYKKDYVECASEFPSVIRSEAGELARDVFNDWPVKDGNANIIFSGGYYDHCMKRGLRSVLQWQKRRGISATYHFIGDQVALYPDKKSADKLFGEFTPENIPSKNNEYIRAVSGLAANLIIYRDGVPILNKIAPGSKIAVNLCYWTTMSEFRKYAESQAVVSTGTALAGKIVDEMAKNLGLWDDELAGRARKILEHNPLLADFEAVLKNRRSPEYRYVTEESLKAYYGLVSAIKDRLTGLQSSKMTPEELREALNLDTKDILAKMAELQKFVVQPLATDVGYGPQDTMCRDSSLAFIEAFNGLLGGRHTARLVWGLYNNEIDHAIAVIDGSIAVDLTHGQFDPVYARKALVTYKDFLSDFNLDYSGGARLYLSDEIIKGIVSAASTNGSVSEGATSQHALTSALTVKAAPNEIPAERTGENRRGVGAAFYNDDAFKYKLPEADDEEMEGEEYATDYAEVRECMKNAGKLLTFEDEQLLFRAYNASNRTDVERLEIRDFIISKNTGLLKSVAISQGLRPKQPEFEDALQDGIFGLAIAIDKFHYRLGFKFSTYATWWVRSAIQRSGAVQELVSEPAGFRVLRTAIRRTRNILTEELKRDPTTEEIAKRLGVGEERLIAALSCRRPVLSIESKAGGDDNEDFNLRSTLESTSPKPAEEASKKEERKIAHDQILKHLDRLDRRSQVIMKMRYGIGTMCNRAYTLEDMGNLLGLSRERVRQIEERAFKLKKRGGRMAGAVPAVMDDADVFLFEVMRVRPGTDEFEEYLTNKSSVLRKRMHFTYGIYLGGTIKVFYLPEFGKDPELAKLDKPLIASRLQALLQGQVIKSARGEKRISLSENEIRLSPDLLMSEPEEVLRARTDEAFVRSSLAQIDRKDLRASQEYEEALKKISAKGIVGPAFWGSVSLGIQRELVLRAMEEVPYSADLFFKPLKCFDEGRLRTLYNYYALIFKEQYAGISKADRPSLIDFIAEELDIEDFEQKLSMEAVLERIRDGKRIVWHKVPVEVQLQLIEIAAEHLEKGLTEFDSTWFIGDKKGKERIVHIPQLEGRSLIGLYQYYCKLFGGVQGDDNLIDIMRIRLGLPEKIYTAEDVMNGMKRGYFVYKWRKVPNEEKRRLLEMIAKEKGVKPAALTATHLTQDGAGTHDFRGMLYLYRRQGERFSDALRRLKIEVGIPSLDTEDILNSFKRNKPVYWKGVYSTAVKRELIELLAKDLRRKPERLLPHHFMVRRDVFYGKSLGGLAFYYKDPSGVFDRTGMERLFDEIGVVPRKDATFDDYLHSLETGSDVDWQHMPVGERKKVIIYFAAKAGKKPSEITIYTETPEGDKIDGLLAAYAREHNILNNKNSALKMYEEYGLFDDELVEDAARSLQNEQFIQYNHQSKQEQWDRAKQKLDIAIRRGLGNRLPGMLCKYLDGTTASDRDIRMSVLDYLMRTENHDSLPTLIAFVSRIGTGDYPLWKKANDTIRRIMGEAEDGLAKNGADSSVAAPRSAKQAGEEKRGGLSPDRFATGYGSDEDTNRADNLLRTKQANPPERLEPSPEALKLMQRISAYMTRRLMGSKEDPLHFMAAAWKGWLETVKKYGPDHPDFEPLAVKIMERRILDQARDEGVIGRNREVNTNIDSVHTIKPQDEELFNHTTAELIGATAPMGNGGNGSHGRSASISSLEDMLQHHDVRLKNRKDYIFIEEMRGELQEILENSSDRLTPSQLHVIKRIHLDTDHPSQTRVAAELGKPLSTVNAIYKSAVHDIKRILEKKQVGVKRSKEEIRDGSERDSSAGLLLASIMDMGGPDTSYKKSMTNLAEDIYNKNSEKDGDFIAEMIRGSMVDYIYRNIQEDRPENTDYTIRVWEGYGANSQLGMMQNVQRKSDNRIEFEKDINRLVELAARPENINKRTVTILPREKLTPEQGETLAEAVKNGAQVIYINLNEEGLIKKEALLADELGQIEGLMGIGRSYLNNDEKSFYKFYNLLAQKPEGEHVSLADLKANPDYFIDRLKFVLRPIKAHDLNDLPRLNRELRKLLESA